MSESLLNDVAGAQVSGGGKRKSAQSDAAPAASRRVILPGLLRLRQICSLGAAADGACVGDAEGAVSVSRVSELVAASCKLAVVDALLAKGIELRDKVVIASSFLSVLDAIEVLFCY